MSRLPLKSLGLIAERSVSERGGRSYESLVLQYYVADAGRRQLLVRIDLEDTIDLEDAEASEPSGRHRFWFHYQPIELHLPPVRRDDESVDPSAKPVPPIVLDFPSIDLVVYSSVRVTVRRLLLNMEKYQAIGFEGMSDAAIAQDAMFSPTRPKISLRRVHRAVQVPFQGTPLYEQLMQPDFSFYSDGHVKADRTFATHVTMEPAADVLLAMRGTADVVVADRTWTRVFCDEQFTEFTFPESGYRLRVYDQGYDEIDRQAVRNVVNSDEDEQIVNLKEAREKEYTGEILVSHPKYFRYELGVDNTPAMAEHIPGPGEREAGYSYTIDYRTTLTIWKSPNVHLVGTVDRHATFDQRTNAILERVPKSLRPAKVRYRDYLPWLSIRDESDNPLPLSGGLETSSAKAGYLYEKSGYQRYLEFQMSLFIGFTPMVGEAFGLYELYAALAHDEDAFGNPLTDNEKIIVAIAAVLPLVNFKMLRGAARSAEELSGALARLFPGLSDSVTRNGASARTLATLPERRMARYAELEPALARLRKAMLSKATRTEITEAIVVLGQLGKQLNAKESRKVFLDLMSEVAPSLKSGGLEFAMEAMQKAYDAEVKGKMTSFPNAFVWFSKSESKLVKELRRRLTGLEYDSLREVLNVTGNRMISAASVVHSSYLPKLVKPFEKAVQAAGPRAKLDQMLKPLIDSGAVKRFQETGLISDVDFWRAKGAIMELLAEETKLRYLKGRFPKAFKIEGVMAITSTTRQGKTSKSTGLLQIWDGIIAEIKGDQLIIHVKFEIKSGSHGFEQGTTQILDTFYHRFVSKGDTLQLTHKGKTMTFVNSPNVPNSIKGADSLNVLITPKGVSDTMPNQAVDYVDFPLEYLLLKLDDIELHHRDVEALTMRFLKSLTL